MDLSNVKPGDKLAEDLGGGMGCRWRPVIVARVTAMQIKGECGTRWKRRDGRRVSSTGYDYCRLTELTPEVQQAIDAERLKSWARYSASGEISKLPPEQIRQVQELVERLAEGATGEQQ